LKNSIKAVIAIVVYILMAVVLLLAADQLLFRDMMVTGLPKKFQILLGGTMTLAGGFLIILALFLLVERSATIARKR